MSATIDCNDVVLRLRSHETEGVTASDRYHLRNEAAAEIDRLRQIVYDHNEGCIASCAAQRPNERESGGCGYQRHDGSTIYSRRCPTCPQDWKIENDTVIERGS